MQLHELKPIHSTKRKKRVGRGGKKGTYSGRGIKGQNARAGRKKVPIIREIIKKYPKLRGYRWSRIKEPLSIVNLDMLEQKCQDGELINPQVLLEKGIIERIKGKIPKVKILARGSLTKRLTIENCLLSKSAKETIEKVGGEIKNMVK
mgnify:CR=1 FL=1